MCCKWLSWHNDTELPECSCSGAAIAQFVPVESVIHFVLTLQGEDGVPGEDGRKVCGCLSVYMSQGLFSITATTASLIKYQSVCNDVIL